MSVEILSGPPYLSLFPEGRLGGYALLFLYAVVAVALLSTTYRDWFKLTSARWGIFAGLLIFTPVFQLLVIRLNSDVLLSPPGLPLEPHGPALALLGAIPPVLAGGYLGVGPAFVVGFSAGLTRSLFDTYSLTTPFEVAFLAALIAALLRQDYRGLPARWLRRPMLAAPLAAALIWPVTFFGLWAYSPAGGLTGLDYVTVLWTAIAPALIGEAIVGGLFGELALATTPKAWPWRVGTHPPPYARSLNRQLLFALIPLAVLGLATLFWADTRIAINVATRLVVDQMSRDAQNAAKGIPFFIQTGRSLVRDLARDERLLDPDPAVRQTRLEQSLRAIPYFRQLVLFDSNLTPIAAYPIGDVTALGLTADEQRFIELALQGVPQQTTLYPENQIDPIQLSFITPVVPPSTSSLSGGSVRGVLLGRADIESNPLMQPVVNNLQGLLVGSGQGFIVDERQRIIYHPDRSQMLLEWQPNTAARQLAGSNAPTLSGALAYEDRASDGTRRLVFYLPVGGHPWSVVITVPYQVVLALATQISTQILLILLLIGGLGLIVISLVAGRLTQPLESLARAAAHISQGDLERPVEVAGEDEVGRLGLAFEQMRERLKARLEELGLLLRVTKSVAENLNLEDALPPILHGVLSATTAAGVRLIIPPAPGSNAAPAVFALGPAAPMMAPLDRDVLAITRAEGAVTIENVSRARAVLDVSGVLGKIQALAALPLRHETTYHGALWLGYDKPHTFSSAEINFLTTLAGQAAVAVANTRLFEAAEGGRQRLAAILASVSDAVIVTEPAGRIVLLNPAAEAVFGLVGRGAVGKKVSEAIDRPELVEALTNPTEAPSPLTREVPLPDGRTLYASITTMRGADGATLGRVAVLRDVTHFKQLEELKTEFVATVSHDLRAPLTFMRGYATMLPMVGTLNVKQKDFADKIIAGIQQMTELIDNLLDLGRLEAGVGLVKEACRLEDLVGGAVEPLRAQAVNKQLTLTMDMPPDLPPIQGDAALLRQAIANLVDNAIKYTPQGGSVRIHCQQRDANVVLAVSDTGVGIAPADQARLFEKFYRVKQRDTIHVKGSGLGLAIVKSVAERHGGKVWMESRLGRGSTFFMSLPVNGGG